MTDFEELPELKKYMIKCFEDRIKEDQEFFRVMADSQKAIEDYEHMECLSRQKVKDAIEAATKEIDDSNTDFVTGYREALEELSSVLGLVDE